MRYQRISRELDESVVPPTYAEIALIFAAVVFVVGMMALVWGAA